MEIITAVYEDGVLRPLEPVDLVEHQTVRLQLLPDVASEEVEATVRQLIASGKLTPPPHRLKREPRSEATRQAQAKRMGQRPGKPVSEIIIEDRGDR